MENTSASSYDGTPSSERDSGYYEMGMRDLPGIPKPEKKRETDLADSRPADLPDVDRRSGHDRRSGYNRRSGKDRRKKKSFRLIERRKNGERRSGRERRSGKERRIFNWMLSFEKGQYSGENFDIFSVSALVPSMDKTVIRGLSGRIIAYTCRKDPLYSGQGNNFIEICQENSKYIVLRFDHPSGDATIRRDNGKEHPLNIDSSIHEPIKIITDRDITVRIGIDSIGHINISSKMAHTGIIPKVPPEKPVKITIALDGLGDNMEHLVANTFRFGKMVAEIDQSQVVELTDRSERKCIISGRKGPENLEMFRAGLI